MTRRNAKKFSNNTVQRTWGRLPPKQTLWNVIAQRNHQPIQQLPQCPLFQRENPAKFEKRWMHENCSVRAYFGCGAWTLNLKKTKKWKKGCAMALVEVCGLGLNQSVSGFEDKSPPHLDTFMDSWIRKHLWNCVWTSEGIFSSVFVWFFSHCGWL